MIRDFRLMAYGMLAASVAACSFKAINEIWGLVFVNALLALGFIAAKIIKNIRDNRKGEYRD